MLNNRFALSDLENKPVNIDTELSCTTLYDTTILKKLTVAACSRAERSEALLKLYFWGE